jgi:hypothetical protein
MRDFLCDDEFILGKLKKSKDKQILEILSVLRNKALDNLPKSKIVAHKKFRHVDPLFLDNGNLFRLSEVDEKFKRELEIARKENDKGINLPLLAL